MADHPLGTVLQERAEENELDTAEYDFAQEIALGVNQNKDRLDRLIAQHAPEWPLDQVAIIVEHFTHRLVGDSHLPENSPQGGHQ